MSMTQSVVARFNQNIESSPKVGSFKDEESTYFIRRKYSKYVCGKYTYKTGVSHENRVFTEEIIDTKDTIEEALFWLEEQNHKH